MTETKLSEKLEESFVRCRDLEAPLADRLQAFANELRRLDPRFDQAVDALVSRLAESCAGATAPKVGEPMPTFLLPDDQGRLVRLEDLLGKGPVALAFNRGHWCPYCRINIDALARAERRSLLSTATLPRSCPIDKSSRCGSDPKPRRRFQFSRIWTTAMR